MPALVLFGQKTVVAGDDLRSSSSAMFLVFHILELALLVPVLVFLVKIDTSTAEICKAIVAIEAASTSTFTANGRAICFLFWGFTLAQVVAGLSLQVGIWRTSMIGSPTEPEKRAALRPLCFLHLVPVTVLRILTFILGVCSCVVIQDFCECGEDSLLKEEGRDQEQQQQLADLLQDLAERRCPNFNSMYRVMVGLTWTLGIEAILVGFVMYGVFVLKVVKPRQRLREAMSSTNMSISVHTESWWKFSCRFCCACTSVLTCCLFGGKEAITSDFADVAMALTDFMDGGGHLDVTLSDIVAGLRMVRRVQKEKQEELESREKVQTEEEGGGVLSAKQRGVAVRMSFLCRDGSFKFAERLVFDSRDAVDRQVIAEGAHFMRLSKAVYGYIMYMLERKLTGPCVLAAASLNFRRSCCWWSRDNVIGDNIFGCNLLAMLRKAGLDQEDIAYAQFGVGLERTPYCITLDHEWKGVVITIRGTLSLEDAVTDLSIRPVPLRECGERCSFDGEGEYCHNGTLVSAEWVFEDLEKHGILDKLLLGNDCRYPGYRLYVTGHSLGGGCAATLSLMLKHKFPSLKCLCFSPPSMMSAGVAVAGQAFITSFILDADIVPRLSYQSMEHLRNDVLEMIARIKVPKYQIMAGLRGKTFAESNAETLHRSSPIKPSTFSRQLEKFKEHQQGMYRRA
jgi:sn1-specific diacylglycerol lipase